MASEDSDQLWFGRFAVHRLHHLRDLQQPVGTEVPTFPDDSQAQHELFKVPPLWRAKRMTLEERDYRPQEVLASIHDVLRKWLAVIVVPPMDVDPTHAEEVLQLFQRGAAADALRHDEPVRHLIPGLVAFPIRAVWLPNESDEEASLSVYKASNPAKLNQPFLLISCTHSIVTVLPAWDRTRSLGYSGFPAYSQMHTA